MSWGEVFDEYAAALISYARSRGVREAEDLVQDVFVAAVKQLPDFVGDRSGLRSLLFSIAYRRIADHHRRCYRRPETLVAEHSPRADPGPTVEQIVDLGEAAGRAMQAFAVLSARERQVIEMRLLDEASPSSVGLALGLSSGNVRVIQARALVKIRKHLRSMGEGGFALPLVAFGALSDPVRYLRTRLPTDSVVGPWIEEMRSNLAGATLEDSTQVGSASLGSGSMAVTAHATETAYSLVSAVFSSGAARIGAAVSVVALSAAPLLPAVFLGAESSSSLDQTSPAVEVVAIQPLPVLDLEDEMSPGNPERPSDHVVVETPTSFASIPVETPQAPRQRPADDAVSDTGSPAGELVEVPEVTTTPDVTEDVVTPLVDGVVDTLPVDDVVEPLADAVVVVVEDTVEVVDEVVQALIDDVVEPLVEDVVTPLVDDLNGTVDAVVPGLGGLLGGH
jgi:RNA polymerase sigma-70 factor (ECF subfamily)